MPRPSRHSRTVALAIFVALAPAAVGLVAARAMWGSADPAREAGDAPCALGTSCASSGVTDGSKERCCGASAPSHAACRRVMRADGTSRCAGI